jgi:hypothetical protein
MTLAEIFEVEFAEHIALFKSHELSFKFRVWRSRNNSIFCVVAIIDALSLPFTPHHLNMFNTVVACENVVGIAFNFSPADSVKLELDKYINFAQLRNESYVDCYFETTA